MIRSIPVLFLFMLLSCGPRSSTPEGILPPDRMEAVLWDLIRSGEFLNGYLLYKDTMTDRTAESLKWYDKVLAMHKLSKQEFRHSYDWYRENPKMMTEVLDSLSRLPAPPALIDTTNTPVVVVDSARPYPVKNTTPDPRRLLQERDANGSSGTPLERRRAVADSIRKRTRLPMVPI